MKINKLFYNHVSQRVFSLGKSALENGKVIGYYVRGVKRSASAIYTLDIICDALEYGFASLSNGLTLEVIN